MTCKCGHSFTEHNGPGRPPQCSVIGCGCEEFEEANQLERRGVVRVRMVDVEYEGDSDACVAMLVGLLNGLLDGQKGSSRS